MRRVVKIFFLVVFMFLIFVSVFKCRELMLCHRALKVDYKKLSDRNNGLNSEIADFKKSLDDTENEIADLKKSLDDTEKELVKVQGEIEKLNDDIPIMEIEKETMRNKLKSEIIRLRGQRDALKVRLDCVGELKKALKAAEEKERLVRKQYKEDLDKMLLEMGNKGYIVKDGTSTLGVEPHKKITVEIIMPTGLK